MGNDLIVGLQLGAIGLIVTFLALGLLMFVMIALQRIFPAKSEIIKALQKESQGIDDDFDQRLEEMAVALAVGISLLESENAFAPQDPSLGKLLEE